MPLLPELADALANDPIFSPPPPPPPGVPLHQHMREHNKVLTGASSKHLSGRLPPDSQYGVSDKLVSVEGGEIPVRLLTPAGGAPGSTYPVLVWFHGGGWMMGDIDQDDNYLRIICVELQVAVANVEYRHSPEHPFPAPFEDSYTAVKWVADHAASFNVSLSKGFLVGGDSSGANIAAAIALQARDDPFFAGKPLTGQYLREPAVVHPLAWPEKFQLNPRSWDVNGDLPLLNRESVLNLFNAYGAPPSDLRLSPLLASAHTGLPPAFIQVMEMDPIRDDGIVYERVLREAGISTKLIEYPGIMHGVYYFAPTLQTSIKVVSDSYEGLKWLLSLTA